MSKKRFKKSNGINKLKKENAELKKMAYFDYLTGLPNRNSMNKKIDEIILDSTKNNKIFSLFYVDLDNFKYINDTLGHDIGDVLLKQVSERLKNCLNKGGFIFRQGGDEFIIIVEESDRNIVTKEVQKITDSFNEPFILNNLEYKITTSVGISTFLKNGITKEELIKKAEIAMYEVKYTSKNDFKFYESDNDQKMIRKRELDYGLRKALKNNKFKINYQPQIDLKTNKIISAETLIEWNHPKLGLIPPMEFISLAEENQLIIPIGNWLVREVCEQIKNWEKDNIPISKVAINVSMKQFEDEDFVKNIENILKETKINPRKLELEITESLMCDVKNILPVLTKLKNMGIVLSLDDFGTGYSSLSLLCLLPIDYVKIDRSFIQKMLIDSKIESMVKMIISIGETYGFKLIAEGIETKEQAEFLRENGCQIGQGYLYSQAVSPQQLESLILKDDLENTTVKNI